MRSTEMDRNEAALTTGVEADQRVIWSALQRSYDFTARGSHFPGFVAAQRLAEDPAVSGLTLQADSPTILPKSLRPPGPNADVTADDSVAGGASVIPHSRTFSEEDTAYSSRRRLRVLVIDDDDSLRRSLASYLEPHDMRVVATLQRAPAMMQISAYKPTFVILDRYQGGDSFDLLREIRSRSNVPLIITDGNGRGEIDCVVGLELGADDYVLKPCSGRELYARIQAVLRGRQRAGSAIQRDRLSTRHRFGGWTLDRRARRLTNPSSIPVILTRGEFALLIAFLDAPQRPLSREYLLSATRVQEDIIDRSIDLQVMRLRRKLEPDPSAPRIILTERGVGYTFAPSVETLRNPISI